jgi:hypothetical protein
LLRSVHARTGCGDGPVGDVVAQALTTPPLTAVSPTASLAPDVASFEQTEAARPEAHDAVPPELARHERYRVVRLIGQGGMGAVYEAEHRVMRRPVGLKVVNRAYTAQPATVERFRREVRAAARLSHPNIVTTYDAEDAGGSLFLVMEYVEGVSLARLVKERGPLPVAEACAYIRQAALGLQHAHERGMVHRDVKPDNLILVASPNASEPGVVKVLDFGLTALTAERGEGLTEENVVMGTPEFMAPEQAEDPHKADIRADVYSLGCTLYFLLTGKVPYPASTRLLKILAHREQQVPSIRQARPDVPAELARVLERMLAKKPADRYATPGEVAAALRPYTQTAAVPLPARRPRLVAIALAALFGGLLVAGGAVYRIQTDKGEIVLKTEDPDIEVVIKRGGQLVRITDLKKNQTWELDTAKYEIGMADQPDGLKIELPGKEPFVLKRADKGILTISWDARGAGVRPPDGPDGEKGGNKPRFVARIVEPDLAFHAAIARFSPDGRYLIVPAPFWDAKTKVIRVWEAETGKLFRSFSNVDSVATGAIITPDGKQLLTCHQDGTFRLWDLATRDQRQAKQFARPRAPTVLWGFSPDGKHVAAFEFIGHAIGHFRVWDFETGKERVAAAPLAPDSFQQYCRFTPDGKHLVTLDTCDTAATDQWSQIRLHDLGSGKVASSVKAQGWVGSPAAFREGGRQVGVCRYSSEDGWAFEFFDLESGKSAGRIVLGVKEADFLAMTPDGRFGVVGAKGDRAVRFFDLSTRKEVHRLTDVREGGEDVIFSADGRRVAVGKPGSVSLFRLPDPPPAKDEP